MTGGDRARFLYTPWATDEFAGPPIVALAPGARWILRPGTASSPIMLVPPREPEAEGAPLTVRSDRGQGTSPAGAA